MRCGHLGQKLERLTGIRWNLLPLHRTWRCAYQDRVAPVCTGLPVFWFDVKTLFFNAIYIDFNTSSNQLPQSSSFILFLYKILLLSVSKQNWCNHDPASPGIASALLDNWKTVPYLPVGVFITDKPYPLKPTPFISFKSDKGLNCFIVLFMPISPPKSNLQVKLFINFQ